MFSFFHLDFQVIEGRTPLFCEVSGFVSGLGMYLQSKIKKVSEQARFSGLRPTLLKYMLCNLNMSTEIYRCCGGSNSLFEKSLRCNCGQADRKREDPSKAYDLRSHLKT